MRINVQSYSGTSGGERFMQELASRVEVDLIRCNRRITNVDVLIFDDDDTRKAKHCVIEASVLGADPIAVQAHAGTFEKAVDAGAEKIEELVGTTVDERFTSGNAETVDWTAEE